MRGPSAASPPNRPRPHIWSACQAMIVAGTTHRSENRQILGRYAGPECDATALIVAELKRVLDVGLIHTLPYSYRSDANDVWSCRAAHVSGPASVLLEKRTIPGNAPMYDQMLSGLLRFKPNRA